MKRLSLVYSCFAAIAPLLHASPMIEQLPLALPAKFGSTAEFLRHVDETLSANEGALNDAAWRYATNITDYNREKQTEAELSYNVIFMGILEEAKYYKGETFDEKRQLKLLQLQSSTPKSTDDQRKLSELESKMVEIYSTSKYNNQNLDPGLTEVLATSRDYQTLLDTYIGWRNATRKMKPMYEEFIKVMNIGPRENGYENMAQLLQSDYDMEPSEFVAMIEKTWQQVLPLYEQLHCYTKFKLMEKYGEDKFSEDGYIPAHILGNMWSQSWENIYDILIPFPEVTAIDITPELKKQGYDAVRMHKTSESFYKSLGYDPLPETFWEKSMLVKPNDREAVCHASAWDFGNNDLRIKMCTVVNGEDFITIHHEQGHLYYDHYYRNQHSLYRSGAADFFHESIGDTMTLSVVTPTHLRKIGLLEPEDDKSDDGLKNTINAQMSVALSKIAILPWTFLVDLWRWKVMSGEVTVENYQNEWEKLVEHYQGLKRPHPSTSEDFDPGCKYHIPGNTPYIRYFGAALIQFQFHESLCKTAGHTGPLHECDIFKNQAAGKQFKEMLSLGRSKKWQEAIKVGTGGKYDTLDGRSLVKYFEPLLKWLKESNKGKKCSWKKHF